MICVGQQKLTHNRKGLGMTHPNHAVERLRAAVPWDVMLVHLQQDDARSILAYIDAIITECNEAQLNVTQLREALINIDALDPGKHLDGCTHYATRGLVERMGEIARTALLRTAVKASQK